MLDKVLVANRSEIALRVIRACQELGVPSVAVYSDADEEALHVRHADEAVNIGPPPAGQELPRTWRPSSKPRRRRARKRIHPGYGFLAENAYFAAACRDAGLVFVGPSAEAIEKMGNKSAARRLADEAERACGARLRGVRFGGRGCGDGGGDRLSGHGKGGGRGRRARHQGGRERGGAPQGRFRSRSGRPSRRSGTVRSTWRSSWLGRAT